VGEGYPALRGETGPVHRRRGARTHARPRYCARKTMRLFRANVDSAGDGGGLSIRTRCGGTSFRGARSPFRTAVNLFPIHYGVLPPCVPWRRANLALGRPFAPHFRPPLSPFARARAGGRTAVAALIISVVSTAATGDKVGVEVDRRG